MSSSRIGSVGSNDPFGALTDKLKEYKKTLINGKGFFFAFCLKTKQKCFSRVRSERNYARHVSRVVEYHKKMFPTFDNIFHVYLMR